MDKHKTGSGQVFFLYKNNNIATYDIYRDIYHRIHKAVIPNYYG